LNKVISSAVLKTITSELRQENYIGGWQHLKDYYMRASSFSTTNVIKAAQEAKFETNEHLEQWVDKMKKLFYNIALVNFLTKVQNMYPNEPERWRPNHIEIENNSWDKNDDIITNLHHSLLLSHTNRLQYLINSISLHPSNRYKIVLDNFRLKPSNELTVSTLYNNLLLWDNSESTTNTISNDIIVMNVTNEKCKWHPNSNHSLNDCRHPGNASKSNNSEKNKNNRNKGTTKNNKQKLNNKSKTSSSLSLHCTNCAIKFPNIASTHNTDTCFKEGGPLYNPNRKSSNNNNTNNNKSNNKQSNYLSPTAIANAITSSINLAISSNNDKINQMFKNTLATSIEDN
jgi:hypothetical protein